MNFLRIYKIKQKQHNNKNINFRNEWTCFSVRNINSLKIYNICDTILIHAILDKVGIERFINEFR